MNSKFENIWKDFSEDQSIGISTIEDCSFDDDNKVVLINSEKPAINFDKASEVLVKRLDIRQKPKSVDCLYLENEWLILTEFKNITKINKKIDDIKLKIHDSLLLLNFLYKFDEDDFRFTEIIIVQKGNAPVASNQKSSSHLKGLANSSCPPRLKFLQKGYRIKISSMYQDEYLKRIE